MRSVLSAVAVSIVLFSAQPLLANDAPPTTEMIVLDKSNKARSSYTSLHKKLDQLRTQFSDVDGRRMLSTLKGATRDLGTAKKKDPSLDLSAEEAELVAYGALAEDLVAKAKVAKERDKKLKSADREAMNLSPRSSRQKHGTSTRAI